MRCTGLPVGEGALTQEEAARQLTEVFYYWKLSTANPPERIPHVLRLRDSKMLLPTPELCAMRRNYLLPAEFRFTWPDLPQPGRFTKGARYVAEEQSGAA